MGRLIPANADLSNSWLTYIAPTVNSLKARKAAMARQCDGHVVTMMDGEPRNMEQELIETLYQTTFSSTDPSTTSPAFGSANDNLQALEHTTCRAFLVCVSLTHDDGTVNDEPFLMVIGHPAAPADGETFILSAQSPLLAKPVDGSKHDDDDDDDNLANDGSSECESASGSRHSSRPANRKSLRTAALAP